MAIQEFEANEIVSRAGVNSRISDINNMFPLSIGDGGTGQTTLSSGHILFGNGSSGITSAAKLPISKGGTNGTTAKEARTNLDVLTTYVLYTSTSGTNGTIDFSSKLNSIGKELKDFKYLEFYYSNKANDSSSVMHDDGMCCTKVYRWTASGNLFNNTINLGIHGATKIDNVTYFTVANTRYSIGLTSANKSKAVRNTSKSYTFNARSNGEWFISSGADIYVFRVVGYTF